MSFSKSFAFKIALNDVTPMNSAFKEMEHGLKRESGKRPPLVSATFFGFALVSAFTIDASVDLHDESREPSFEILKNCLMMTV